MGSTGLYTQQQRVVLAYERHRETRYAKGRRPELRKKLQKANQQINQRPAPAVSVSTLRRPKAEAALRVAERRDVRRTVSRMASAMQALRMKRDASGEPWRVVAAEALRRPEALAALRACCYRKAPTLTYKVLSHLPNIQGFRGTPESGPPQPPQGR